MYLTMGAGGGIELPQEYVVYSARKTLTFKDSPLTGIYSEMRVEKIKIQIEDYLYTNTAVLL